MLRHQSLIPVYLLQPGQVWPVAPRRDGADGEAVQPAAECIPSSFRSCGSSLLLTLFKLG